MTPAAGNPRQLAEELRGRALGLLESGDFPAALSLYDEALESAREGGEKAFVDWIYACRAAAAAETGPAEEELVELKRILLRASDQQTAFRAAYTGARIYELRRDFRKAVFYSRIASQKASAIGDPMLLAASENMRGGLLVEDSRFEEGAEAYRSSLVAASDGISPLWRALAKDNLGYCLMSLDKVEEGLALVHEAFELIESQGAKPQTIFPLLDLCFGYLKADRYAESRYFGEEGLERVPLSGEIAQTVEKNFLYLLGETCHLSGDEPAAQSYFDRLAALYPEFRNLRAYLEVFDFRNVINLRS